MQWVTRVGLEVQPELLRPRRSFEEVAHATARAAGGARAAARSKEGEFLGRRFELVPQKLNL